MACTFKKLNYGIWRCVVDRVDRENDTLRAEFIYQNKGLEFSTVRAAINEGKPEIISWWNPEKQHILEFTIGDFQREVGLTQTEFITEGMVYWLQKSEHVTNEPVLRATFSARALAKSLYGELLNKDIGLTPENNKPE